MTSTPGYTANSGRSKIVTFLEYDVTEPSKVRRHRLRNTGIVVCLSSVVCLSGLITMLSVWTRYDVRKMRTYNTAVVVAIFIGPILMTIGLVSIILTCYFNKRHFRRIYEPLTDPDSRVAVDFV